MDAPERDLDAPAVTTAPGTRKPPTAFSACEAAILLGIHERTVRRAIHDGRLEGIRQGRSYVIAPEAIRAYRLLRRQRSRVPATPPETIDHQLVNAVPRPLTSFVGRRQEIADIASLIASGNRLVTLIGPGGVGKTRLAIAIAMAMGGTFEGGAVFVPLAAISSVGQVLGAIALELGIQETPGRTVASSLARALHDQRMLLMLDNFEHVLPAAPEVVSLLEACPEVTIIVTSRSSLRVSGEQRFLTLPLSLPPSYDALTLDELNAFEATALFVERAHAVRHDFAPDANEVRCVIEICRRLEGLPLAIELAAPWVRVLPPSVLLDLLEPQLPLLRGGGEDQPARLRSMRDAISWSYGLLSDEEARLFRRLGVFRDGFTLEAARRIGDGTEQFSLDTLTELIDKSMVRPELADTRESRYHLLEVVQEFALERLAEAGEEDAAGAAHAGFILDLVEEAEPDMLGPDERLWRARLDMELGNVRMALAWALEHNAEVALRIAGAAWVYWSWQLIPEGQRWLTRALDRATRAPAPARARAFLAHAFLASLTGDLEQLEASSGNALALALDSRNPTLEAMSRWVAASSYLYSGDANAAAPMLDLALEVFASSTSSAARARWAQACAHRGLVAIQLGHVERAITWFEEGLERAEEAGSVTTRLYVQGEFAHVLIELGDTARARELVEAALVLGAPYESFWPIVNPMSALALLEALEGSAMAAARLIGAHETFLHRKGIGLPCPHAKRIARAAAVARASLGEATYAAAWEGGRTSPDTAFTEAIAGIQLAGDPGPGPELTQREREVLKCVARGLADKEIAAALGSSRATISRHCASIRAKLGAPSRSAAAAIAVRDGLI